MQCPTCNQEARKFGKDCDGNQRYQCLHCRKTFSDRPTNSLDEMRLPLDKAMLCLKLLTEGTSIRATVRVSGVAKNTVLSLLVCVGQKCETFLSDKLKTINACDVQAEKIWGLVAMKEKTARAKCAVLAVLATNGGSRSHRANRNDFRWVFRPESPIPSAQAEGLGTACR